MKVKAESDELYEELMRKHFYGKSDDIPESDKTEHLKGCG
jgi:signal recognition particle protein